MSWDSDIHNLMGQSQSDPDAIDNIVEALQAGGTGVPGQKLRPTTFGELAKQLGVAEDERTGTNTSRS